MLSLKLEKAYLYIIILASHPNLPSLPSLATLAVWTTIDRSRWGREDGSWGGVIGDKVTHLSIQVIDHT
jgi:hypothetical protein